ncbi:ankyrin repeat-containing domain protein [Aspergillus cavernicola]|uniref:Ankyrin repeat-containing domain protein n=1 Tax=Aspergillus cavernicola TaxID=176166 RepID=A0ABR4HAV3_9EURO
MSVFGGLLDHCTDLPPPCTNPLSSAIAVSVIEKKFEATKLLLIDNPTRARNSSKGTEHHSAYVTVCGSIISFEDSTGRPQYYVSPLTLAVEARDTQTTKQLLQGGVDIQVADEDWDRTLVEHAAMNNDLETCEILLQYGAKVDRPSSDKRQTTSTLLITVKRSDVEIVNLLVKFGARLNNRYQTVFAAALETGEKPSIDILQHAGASNFGERLRYIGNRETAMYMQEQDMLKSVLNASGPRILTAAISRENNDLVHWLLDHYFDANVDVDSYATTRDGLDTPLVAAIAMGNLSLVHLLLDRQAQVTDYELVHAVEHIHDNKKDSTLLQDLLGCFLGIEAPTAVRTATLTGREDLLSITLNDGADPRGTPQLIKGGRFYHIWELAGRKFDVPESVLEIAVESGDASALRTLLQACYWEPRPTGRALAMAIIAKKDDLTAILLGSTVDVNQEVALYPTLKHYPGGKETIANYGADVNAAPERNHGATAL